MQVTLKRGREANAFFAQEGLIPAFRFKERERVFRGEGVENKEWEDKERKRGGKVQKLSLIHI